MRTTVTLDDDVARELQARTRALGRTFKTVLNETIRRGLSLGEQPGESPPPFVVEARARGFRPGVDPYKLNQVYDDLEAGEFARESGRGVHEP